MGRETGNFWCDANLRASRFFYGARHFGLASQTSHLGRFTKRSRDSNHSVFPSSVACILSLAREGPKARTKPAQGATLGKRSYESEA